MVVGLAVGLGPALDIVWFGSLTLILTNTSRPGGVITIHTYPSVLDCTWHFLEDGRVWLGYQQIKTATRGSQRMTTHPVVDLSKLDSINPNSHKHYTAKATYKAG